MLYCILSGIAVRILQHVTITWSVVLQSAYMSSVTVVHPAKTVGWNEMSFGRDTRVVSSNTVLDRGLGLPQEGEIWGSEPPVYSDATYCQITLALVSFVF